MMTHSSSCFPPKCPCSGHLMPGVYHIVACCDEPHIEDFANLFDFDLEPDEEDQPLPE